MNIYILDYDIGIFEFYKNFFRTEFPKATLKFFNNKDHFISEIQTLPPDLVLVEADIENPFDLYEYLSKNKILFIVVSRLFSERIVVESLKKGAYDFVYKGNLKLDYFKLIIARALLDYLRWQKTVETIEQLPRLPEFDIYNNKLRSITFDVSFYEKWNLPLPKFTEGNTYVLNFLTVRIPFRYDVSSYLMSEEEFQNIHQSFLYQLSKIIPDTHSEIWIRKHDAFTAVFHKDNYLEPVLTFLRMQAKFIEILSNLEIEKIYLVCAVEQGNVTYSEKKENIYCEAINFTYHIVERFAKHKLYITDNIYNGLNQRAKKYFFREDTSYEGKTLYYFEYIS